MQAQITVMRSLGPLLTKRIARGSDGKPVSDGSACRMQAGTAVTIPAPDAATLAGKIDTLSRAEAVVLGSIKGVPHGETVNIVTADALAKIDAAQPAPQLPAPATISNFRRASRPGCCWTTT
jgi:hypothetical protein